MCCLQARQRRDALLLLLVATCGILSVSAAADAQGATARTLLSIDLLRVAKTNDANSAWRAAQWQQQQQQAQGVALNPIMQQQQQQSQVAVAAAVPQMTTQAFFPQQQQQQQQQQMYQQGSLGGVVAAAVPLQSMPTHMQTDTATAAAAVPAVRAGSVSTWKQARAAAAAQAAAQAQAQVQAQAAQAAAAQLQADMQAAAKAKAQAQVQAYAIQAKAQAELQARLAAQQAQVQVAAQMQAAQQQQQQPQQQASIMSASDPALFRRYSVQGPKPASQTATALPPAAPTSGASSPVGSSRAVASVPKGNLQQQFEKYKLTLPPNLLSPSQRAALAPHQAPVANPGAQQPGAGSNQLPNSNFGGAMPGFGGATPAPSFGARGSLPSLPSLGSGGLPGLGSSGLPGLGSGSLPGLGGGASGFPGLGSGLGGGSLPGLGGGSGGGMGGFGAGGGIPSLDSLASGGSLPGLGGGGLPGMGGTSPGAAGGGFGSLPSVGAGGENAQKNAPWPEEPGFMIKNEPSDEGLTAHSQISFRMGMARLYDPFACMGAMAGLKPLQKHVTGVVASMLQRRGVDHKITSGILDCTAETFQNTTIIVVMDVAHQPKDEAVVDTVVQFLTVDYGQEFCDFYGARCNRQMIETCRVKSVPEIPSSVKLTWVEHKVPIAPKGRMAAAAAAPAAAAPAAAAPATSFSLI